MQIIKKVLNLFVWICSVLFASGQDTMFDQQVNSWESALEQSKKTGLPIFADIYTQWCGPCKWMDKNVFSDPNVIAFFSKRFISLKIDAEKGYGIELAKRNNITAYPSFLFFSSEGKLVLVGEGSKPKDVMLKVAADALQNIRSGISMEDMKRRIGAGERDPAFIQQYINRLSFTKTPNASLLEFYLQSIPADSLYTAETLKLVTTGYVGRMPVDGNAFSVLFHAYQRYPVRSMELMSPWNTLRGRLFEYADSAGLSKDSSWLTEIMTGLQQISDAGFSAEREKKYVLAKYYAAANDSLVFLQAARQFMSHIKQNADSLPLLDSIRFDQALRFKFNFGIKDSAKILQEYRGFKRSFMGESRITSNEISDLVYFFSTRFPAFMKSNLSEVNGWLQMGRLCYEKNKVYVSPVLLKKMEDDHRKFIRTVPPGS